MKTISLISSQDFAHIDSECEPYWSACVSTLAEPVKALVERPSRIQKLLVTDVTDDHLSCANSTGLVKFLRTEKQLQGLLQEVSWAAMFPPTRLISTSRHKTLTEMQKASVQRQELGNPTSKLQPAGLHGPVIPAPTMLTALPDFLRALHALGEEALSGASGVLSTGSIKKAPLYLLLPVSNSL